MLAVDCEQMDAFLHDFFTFIQQLLFPVDSPERPLRQNDLSILDFIMSDFFKNACIRQIHSDPNFLGGSKFFTEQLENMREERRKTSAGKGKQKQTENSSSTADNASSSSSSTSDSPPEMSQKEMQQLLLKIASKLPSTPEAEVVEDRVVTRSSSGKKSSKRQKKQ